MIVRFVPILIVVLIAVSQAVADDPPSWLRQAAAVTPPTYAKEVAGVVLLDEQNTTVSERWQARQHRKLRSSPIDPRGQELSDRPDVLSR